MADTVSSKFSRSFWMMGVVISFALLSFLAAGIIVSISKWNVGNGLALLLLAALSLILVIVYTRTAIRSLKKVLVGPTGIFIERLITRERLIINYGSINNVSSLDVSEKSYYFFRVNYRKLSIELNSGVQVTFTDQQFSNYDELKAAIMHKS